MSCFQSSLIQLLIKQSTVIFSTTVTTDIQNVTATLIETINAFAVQCDFITGSNAQGCMVELVGDFCKMETVW